MTSKAIPIPIFRALSACHVATPERVSHSILQDLHRLDVLAFALLQQGPGFVHPRVAGDTEGPLPVVELPGFVHVRLAEPRHVAAADLSIGLVLRLKGREKQSVGSFFASTSTLAHINTC